MRFFIRNQAILGSVLLAFTTAGCGTLASGRGWGQDATLIPGWEQLGRAAWNAAASPATWGPAAGALAFQVGSADRNLTDWAARRTPVFGSRERADRISYDLRDAAGAIWLVSGMTTPGGDTAGDWLYAKTAGLSVQTVGGIAMRGTVGVVKDTVDRARPNSIDRGSFPSAHASGAAFYATLASRNIETLHLKPMMTMTSDFALGAVTAATAWARIESYQHFPSDVLAGIAGGHFFGAFVTDAFLGMANPRNALFSIDPIREGAIATMKFNF